METQKRNYRDPKNTEWLRKGFLEQDLATEEDMKKLETIKGYVGEKITKVLENLTEKEIKNIAFSGLVGSEIEISPYFVKKFGAVGGIVFGLLKLKHFEYRSCYEEDEKFATFYFPISPKEIVDETGLNEEDVIKEIKKFQEMGILEIRMSPILDPSKGEYAVRVTLPLIL